MILSNESSLISSAETQDEGSARKIAAATAELVQGGDGRQLVDIIHSVAQRWNITMTQELVQLVLTHYQREVDRQKRLDPEVPHAGGNVETTLRNVFTRMRQLCLI